MLSGVLLETRDSANEPSTNNPVGGRTMLHKGLFFEERDLTCETDEDERKEEPEEDQEPCCESEK